MKKLFLVLTLISFSRIGLSQNKKLLKPWIGVAVEEFMIAPPANNYGYMRYEFTKSKLYISFSPGWNEFEQPFSTHGKAITIGLDFYQIEELTDTSLTIFAEGFRRIKFKSEELFKSKVTNPNVLEPYNGKPLYEASDFITPRYIKNLTLRDDIQREVEGFNIKKATHFLATFIVNEEGKIENVKIVEGINEGFDNKITQALLKTSKSWKPAIYQGIPIQTQMKYEIQYLDSIVP